MNIAKDQTSQIDKILYRFKEYKNITDLMYSLLTEVSLLEQTFSDLYNERNLQTAIGKQLDQIGKLIGEERQGKDDDEYRKYLYIRTLVNKSSGTTPEIEEVINRTEDATFIQVFNHYPASIYIYIKTPKIPDPSLIDLIKNMIPAGVSLGYIGYWADEDFDPDIPNAFIPYDTVFSQDLLQLSNGTIFQLSNGTPLLLNVKSDADYIEESYLAENPLYETDALFSRPIESVF